MKRVVIQGGTLIDATGRPPVQDAIVIIENEKIKTVGRKEEVPIAKDSRVINAKGKTILPGFIEKS
jgi:imidazolonepropionase-like amidohydrolase